LLFPLALIVFQYLCWPARQTFKAEGEGKTRSERRGVEGGREGDAYKDAIVSVIPSLNSKGCKTK